MSQRQYIELPISRGAWLSPSDIEKHGLAKGEDIELTRHEYKDSWHGNKVIVCLRFVLADGFVHSPCNQTISLVDENNNPDPGWVKKAEGTIIDPSGEVVVRYVLHPVGGGFVTKFFDHFGIPVTMTDDLL